MQSEYIIEMLNIRKEFPGIVANDNITLQLRRGEIHALLGENGAGKSTLMSGVSIFNSSKLFKHLILKGYLDVSTLSLLILILFINKLSIYTPFQIVSITIFLTYTYEIDIFILFLVFSFQFFQ